MSVLLRRILSAILISCLLLTCLPALSEEAEVSLPPMEIGIDDMEEEEIVEPVADDVASDTNIYGEADVNVSGAELAASYDTAGYNLLQKGDKDGTESASISILQLKLIEMGFLHDEADGTYGANTETAVAAFQRNNGLAETGVADSATQALLLNGTNLTTAYNSMDPENVTLRVQSKLMLWGFTVDTPDGEMGKSTKSALTRFYDYMKGYLVLHPTPSPAPAAPTPEPLGFEDGEVALDAPIVSVEEGDVTINDLAMDFVDGKYEFDVYRRAVTTGESNEDVERVQRRLHVLKYLANVSGTFDTDSERALLYFQKLNQLPQTGVADEKTQRVLFTDEAVRSTEYINQYKLVVDVSDQRVYVYRWNGSDYGELIGKMKCSTGLPGKATATPLGTYSAGGPSGRGEWYYFKDFNCYAKWGYYIVGGIMFHSVIYSRGKMLNTTSVRKLGHPASHGCIRLKVEHAKWIYDNCPKGTTVVIQQ